MATMTPHDIAGHLASLTAFKRGSLSGEPVTPFNDTAEG